MEEKERELREAQEEARRLAEQEALAREQADKVKQTEDAFAVISDLDNALKQFQGALGLSDVSQCVHV